ncbi:MAG: hypothetical protein K2I86_06025 [Prevotella sp.]|nr:hypothetical protein [Prevotella sp.]
MKKALIAMTLLLALGTGAEAASQKHRHTPRQQAELVDTTKQNAVEVYSDTTSVAGSQAAMDDWEESDGDSSKDVKMKDVLLNSMGSAIQMEFVFVLCILLIIFVIAPVLIIIALFYFINKNRAQKMKLAEMAIQKGQPIPEKLLEDKANTITDEYQKGLRQCFVGVGLMIFLGLVADEVGFGVGALVFCIGLGKLVAAKMAEKNNN